MESTTSQPNTHRDVADPLPYVIIFAILFLVALGVLTWTLGVWYKANQCAIFPNIWCSDNWTCDKPCSPGFRANPCFQSTGTTGLASCLFGPNAPGATVCLNTPAGTGGVACSCPTGMANQSMNCFAGCGQNLSEIANGATCCCVPHDAGGSPKCPYTSQNLPTPCRGTNS